MPNSTLRFENEIRLIHYNNENPPLVYGMSWFDFQDFLMSPTFEFITFWPLPPIPCVHFHITTLGLL